MTVKSSLLFAYRLVFPRTDKASSARRSLSGALVCIGISLVPLIVVLTVSNGMIQGMTERIIGLSSSHLEAFIPRKADEASSPEKIEAFASYMAKTDGVTAAYPEINAAALAAGSSYRTGVQIRAVQPEIFFRNNSFRSLLKIVDGSYDNFKAGTKSAVVGQKTAELLGLKQGSSFRIITAAAEKGGNIFPHTALFTVAAVVSSGYQELDSMWVFIPLDTSYSVIKPGTGQYCVLMETADAFSPLIVRIQRKCEEAAGYRANIYRWDELNQSEYENFSSTKVMLVFIMLLIVLVASINISSALVMLVMERRREIAIMKSLGGTPCGITFSFLLTGMTAGCGGVLIGLPIGLACAVNVNKIVRFLEKMVNTAAEFIYLLEGHSPAEFTHINLMDPAYYLTEIPVTVPFKDLAVIVISTIFLSLIVSVIPAYKAGKEKPLETLRKV
ncbi:MAG: ABC transporter permease [Treponema sp.]